MLSAVTLNYLSIDHLSCLVNIMVMIGIHNIKNATTKLYR